MGPNPESRISSFWDPPGQNPESRSSNPDFQGGPPELPKGTSKPEAEKLLKFFFELQKSFVFPSEVSFSKPQLFLKTSEVFRQGVHIMTVVGFFSILSVLGRLQVFF